MDRPYTERAARAALRHYELSGVQETGKYLGRGMHGAIVEVEHKGLRYAAKKFIECTHIDGQRMEARFKECLLHSQLDHPNIVRFIGVYYEPDVVSPASSLVPQHRSLAVSARGAIRAGFTYGNETSANVPVLVTELLPTSLASLLQDKSAWGTVANETKYSILEDVALGLQYLHDRPQPIVHGLFSASTVLLTENMRAKVCGLARLDTEDYNGTEVDIFSYGVLMLIVLTGTLPQSDSATYAYGTTEVERRKWYLSQLGPDHPMKSLIVRCLATHPLQRPTISQVLTHLREASGM